MPQTNLVPEDAETAANPAAIVLNGGRSRRMGTDKASLVVDGMSLLDRVLHAVEAAGIVNVVIAGRGHVSSDGHVGDIEPDQGPLGGIAAAWTHLQASWGGAAESARRVGCDPVLVLACDLPLLNAGILTTLIEASGSHRFGAVAHDGVRPQPLIAAFHPRALDELTAAYHRGERSVRRCSRDWNLTEVHVDSQRVTDADTPDDLRGFVVEWPL